MIELILLDGSDIDTPLANPDRILARQELKHYEMLRSDTRRREFLLGRILLKAALAERNHQRIHDFNTISTTVSATGKPAIAGAEFNLSHDGNAFLLAVGDQAVGVDIESVQNFDDAMMEICFTADERRRISRSHHPDRVATLLWCLKEAAAKAMDDGLLSAIGEPRRQGLFFRGGFLKVAGLDRAYAVCSPEPILPTHILSARPRFDKVFTAFQLEDASHFN
ncbi:MAG: 4'-phosphopantetheinyl transferase superfamily protein [Limisphaerales bacterium]